MNEAALLAAILADPEDDAPRLIFADWLDEHGQGERGEFVRVQVALARWDWGPHWSEEDHLRLKCECQGCVLRRRERELLDAGPAALLNRLAWRWRVHPDIGCEFRRGFVRAVTCAAEDWLRHADAILAAQPVEEVTLTTWPAVDTHDDYRNRRTEFRLTSGPRRVPLTRGMGRGGLPRIPLIGNVTEDLLRLEWPRVREWHLPTADPRRTVNPTPVRY